MGAEMVGTDCYWGPKAGIIAGSDVPFSGLHPYCRSSPPALEQTPHQDGELAHPCNLQLGKLRGEGACPQPRQRGHGTEKLKLSSGIPATLLCPFYTHCLPPRSRPRSWDHPGLHAPAWGWETWGAARPHRQGLGRQPPEVLGGKAGRSKWASFPRTHRSIRGRWLEAVQVRALFSPRISPTTWGLGAISAL